MSENNIKCPVCQTALLVPVTMESGLFAQQCPACEGHWIGAREYHQWLATLPAISSAKHASDRELLALEEQRAKLCPACRRIMLRYHVGYGLPFTLDQCPSCRGVWFDRAEWAVLKAHQLHDEVNAMFTVPWQTAARKSLARQQLTALYARKFGEDYEELLRFRTWLRAHPQRAEMIAFLTDEDPFST